jgi:HK97 family phage portal protein
MSLFNRIFRNRAPTPLPNEGYRIEIITDRGNGFYSWRGSLYKSDVVRSCIRPAAKAIGKTVAKHIRGEGKTLQVNPDPYMRFLLEEPNPYMTGQMLQEKMATQYMLSNNAFSLIVRDENGLPRQMYPVPYVTAEVQYSETGEILIKFLLKNGKTRVFPYRDLIHLRNDFSENDVFGDPPAEALTSLMEIVNITDQGVIKAVQNGNTIKWLLKFQSVTRPEDIRKHVKEFVQEYLSIDSEAGGAAGHDAKFDVQQVKPDSYVPNAAQMDRTMHRLYSFFNTNAKIVQASYTEDEWNAYWEATLEPIAIQMAGEYTRKLFSRKERSFGNRIVFEAANLQYASMATKLKLSEMVDRGALTPNEWRHVFNLAPVEGGDKPIRRLDTAVVTEGGEGD